MREEEIQALYRKKSGCSEWYSECNSKGYKMFKTTLMFVLSNVHQPKMRDLENIITQCERYPEEEKGEHIKLIRGVFNKVK